MSYYRNILSTLLLTLIALLPLTAGAFALPDSSITINITLTSQDYSSQPDQYKLVYQPDKPLEIIYTRFYNIDTAAMRRDPEFANADKIFKSGKFEPLINLSTRYRIFNSDTVRVIDAGLSKLTKELAGMDKEALEHKKEPQTTHVRFDGGGTSLQIITAKGTKTISANPPPNVIIHPIVNEFLKQVFAAYRTGAKNIN